MQQKKKKIFRKENMHFSYNANTHSDENGIFWGF